jgi:hypothetical protein
VAAIVLLGLVPATAEARGEARAPCSPAAPPDAACGEQLDGRQPPEPSTPRSAARAALWVPRLASQALFWPAVQATDFVEHRQVFEWMTAILTTDDGLVGARPELDYSTSFRPTGGLRLFYRRLPGRTEASARLKTGGRGAVLAQVGLAGAGPVALAWSATWDHRDDRLFAGIGPLRDADLQATGRGHARFGSDVLRTDLDGRRPLVGPLHALFHADVQRRDYWQSDRPDGLALEPAEVPGFDGGLRIGHAGLGLALDLGRSERHGSGLGLGAGAVYGHGLGADPSRHLLVTGEAVLAIGGRDRVLLVRGGGATARRLGSATVPFEELVSPAGQVGLRGLPAGRLRGESGLSGTAEYRWFIAFNLDASLFAEIGTVAGPAFRDVDWDRWFPSFGLGLRLLGPRGPYWDSEPLTGLQVAYAPEGGVRILFSLAAF